jgi:hypothetical protein
MSEIFIICCNDGPSPGISIVDEIQYPWPLPGILGGVGGAYFRVREEYISVRTAHYRWLTENEIQEAKNAKA